VTVSPAVVLVGPPGSGKTTIGDALGRRLGLGVRDTDHDIEQTTGSSITELFVEHGEPHFRQLERDAVRAALNQHPGVLSVGGGAVMDPGTRELLRAHAVVFLDVSLAEASGRVGLSAPRPLLLGNVRGRLKGLMEERRPLYLEVATTTVDTTGRAPEEVVEDIVERLGLADGQEGPA
jgi:shikimate kinase